MRKKEIVPHEGGRGGGGGGVGPGNSPPLDQRRDGEADDEREEERRPRVPAEPRRDDTGVGADREEGAVRQVDDLEDAVDDQETERDDVQDASRRDDVEELGSEHALGPLARSAPISGEG